MKVLRTRKLKCGAVRFSIEAEEDEIRAILVDGIKRFVKENKINVKVISADEISVGLLGKTKTYDLSDYEEQYLLDIGFASIMCDYLGISFPSLDTFDKLPTPRKRKSTD
jgi:hypothetical protein